MSEVLPDPNKFSSLGWWIVSGSIVLGAALFGVNQLMELVARWRGDAPEPPNAQLQQSVKALNARVRQLEEWREKLIAKMEEDKLEMLQAGEERASRIHQHIESDRRECDEKLEKLRTQVNDGFQSVSRALGRLEGND
jgi:hypothetical protein